MNKKTSMSLLLLLLLLFSSIIPVMGDTMDIVGQFDPSPPDIIMIPSNIPIGTINIPLNTPFWNITISDISGVFNWSIETSPYVGNASDEFDTNGTKSCPLSGLQPATNYTVYVNVTGSQSNQTFWFETEGIVGISSGTWGIEVDALPIPVTGVPIILSSGTWGIENHIEYFVWGNWSEWWEINYINFSEPTDFVATNIDNQSINLSWTKDVNATHTYIRRKIGSYPTNRTDGEFVVNTTASGYDDTGLNIGTHYYYSAWSYDSSVNIFTYNASMADTCTSPDDPSGLNLVGKTMVSLSWEWTIGTNASRTIIMMNESGYGVYPNSPTNGTEVYNGTSNTTTVSGLYQNTTYYFGIWSYLGCSDTLYSENYIIGNETTVAGAEPPSNLLAFTHNHTQINLSWSKGHPTQDTVIRRQVSSYPTLLTGVEVYNGSDTSYDDIGLSPITEYYYRAWGYNGIVFSFNNISNWNVTLPEPPQNLSGSVTGNDLEITWDKGIGAETTMLRNSSVGYPTLITGNLVYNGTGSNTTIAGVSTVDNFRGWTWNATYNLYSEYVDLLWGGIEINVWKEPEPTIAIQNYTVFITDKEGTDTYENVSANNPFVIDVEDVPHGEKTAVSISKDGYYTQVQYHDLYPNVWYYLDFYLAPDIGGGGDDPSDPDYIPPDDPTNESYGELYLLSVEDVWGSSIEGARMEIRRYINTTEQYETITIRYTDANGQVETYLIPGTFYKVVISKQNYTTEIADYVPSNSIFTKTFRLQYEGGDATVEEELWDGISWSISPNTVYHRTNITFVYNISSSECQLEWYGMRISYFNTTNESWVDLYDVNITNQSCGGELSFITPNATGRYGATFWFKKTNFSVYVFGSDDDVCRNLYITWETITEAVSEIPADILIIIGIFLSIAGMALLVKMGAGEMSGYAGIAIMTIIFMLRPDLNINGVAWWIVMLTTGIVYTILLFLRGRI